MKLTITTFFLFSLINIYGQTLILEPSLISNGGEFLESNSYQLNFSIGEPITATIKGDNNYILSQGFHQPELLSVSSIKSTIGFVEKIEIFPNPTTGQITVKADFLDSKEINFLLFNALGQKFYRTKQSLGTNGVTLNLSLLPSGEYFLKLTNEKLTRQQTFKIIKAD